MAPTAESSHQCVLVRIAADASVPLAECSVGYDGPGSESEVGCVTSFVKARLAEAHPDASAVDPSELAAQMRQHTGQDVTADMARALAGMNMVETTALMPGGTHNGFVHVNLYGDDRGSLKGLPRNARAEAMCAACGLAGTNVYGDVYAGRLIDCDDRFERMDFTLADMDSGAEWVAEARAINARKREGGQGAAEARVRDALGAAGANAQFGSMAAPGGAGLGEESTGGREGNATWKDGEDDGELEVRVSLPEGELREAGAAKLLSVQLLARGTELTGRDEPLLHARGLLRAAAADDLTWFLDKDSNELVVGLCASDGGSWTGRLVGAGGAVEAP
eukprot:PRCOL_00003211-RA